MEGNQASFYDNSADRTVVELIRGARTLFVRGFTPADETMSALQTLAGKRIAVLAANGVDQDELHAAVAALTAAGAEAPLVALTAGRIRGMHQHQPGELLRVAATVDEAVASDYDGLLVPGGPISPDLLRQSAAAREFVSQMEALARPLAFLSQAPLLLVSAGLARQRVLTSWPGIRDDMVNAGAVWLNRPVVRDRTMLFGRGPQDLDAFVRDLPGFFAREPVTAPAAADGVPETARTGTESDPPQQKPSEAPDEPLRWLSAPSVGAMLGLALLGVGVVATNRGRRKREERAADIAQSLAPPTPGKRP
jgi:protease I